MQKYSDRDLMKQTLEALEGLADYRYTERVKATMSALRERLAQPERPADFYDQAFALVQRQGKLIAELEEMLKGRTE
jgi:aconitase A